MPIKPKHERIKNKAEIHPPGKPIDSDDFDGNKPKLKRELDFKPNSHAKAPRANIDGLIKRIEDLETYIAFLESKQPKPK